MANSAVFRQVMKEYEKDRTKAERLYQTRLAELYQKLPRIGEIDKELSDMGAAMAGLILRKGGDKIKIIADMQEMNEALQYEKHKLMEKNGVKSAFLTDIYRCNACKDTGFIEEQRCRCLKQRLIEKYYEMSSLSKVLVYENFDAFKLDYYDNEPDPKYGISPRSGMKTNLERCKDFINNFDTQFANLLLYGETGLGKTFMCNCIAKELLDKGKSVLYVTAAQLFKLVEEIRFNRSQDDEPVEYLNMVINADLLIIDDLGTEFSTILTTSELFNFINTRLLNRSHTIISTNLSPSDFESQYSDRITSRLFGNYALLRFIGKDIRLQKKYNLK